MRATAIIFLCVTGLLPGLARAEAAGAEVPSVELPAQLTLAQALELSRKHGLDLLLAEAAVESARGDLLAASAIPNPSASLGGLWSVHAGPCRDLSGAAADCPAPTFSVGLSDSNAVEDSLSGKRGLRQQVARLALSAAELGRGEVERTFEFQVKQQFVQALVAQEALKLARDVAQTSTRAAELTETRYQAGAVSEADVARAQTARLQADQAVDVAVQNAEQARFALAFLLGVRKQLPPFEVLGGELLDAKAERPKIEAGPGPLIAEAFERRPDLRAARKQLERAEAQLRLSQRLRFPDIGLSAGYAQQPGLAPDIAPPTLSVGLTATLPVFYQQQGEIQRAEADVRAQRVGIAKSESQVVADVQSAWAGYLSARQLLARMESGLLERARRGRDLVLIQLQKGATSLLEYLDAQRTFTSTNLEYLQDLTAYWTSVFNLEQAVSRELR